MPKLVAFQIAAIPDNHLLAMARQFCQLSGQTYSATAHLEGEITAELSFDKVSSKPTAKLVEESSQRLIRRVTFNFSKIDISVVKNSEAKNLLEVQFSPRTDSPPKDDEFLQWLRQAKECFHELVPGVAFQNILGDEANQHYAAREATILKLDQITQELFLKTATYDQDIRVRIEQDREKLEQEKAQLAHQFQEKENELFANFAEKEKLLTEHAADLETREKNLALQASRIERRKTIGTLIEELDSQGDSFKLEVTAGTVAKRRWVLVYSSILLIVLFGLNLALYVQEFRSTPTNVSWIRPTIASISFLLAFVFFVKWLNNWAERHANEEFRLKRVLLDVRRTNLLIEAALEWETETSGAMPEQLLNVLSRNLFVEGNFVESTAPVESLVSLLTHRDTTIEIKSPLAELKAHGGSKLDEKK